MKTIWLKDPHVGISENQMNLAQFHLAEAGDAPETLWINPNLKEEAISVVLKTLLDVGPNKYVRSKVYITEDPSLGEGKWILTGKKHMVRPTNESWEKP